MFDSEFYNTFDKQDGKSAEEHMMEVISVVKVAYKDPEMKREMGANINIIADKTFYDGSMYVMFFLIVCVVCYLKTSKLQLINRNSFSSHQLDQQKQLRSFYESNFDEDKYHLMAFVTVPGATNPGSWGKFGAVCAKENRFSLTRGFGPDECNSYDPPEPIDCTPTNRITLTGQVICINRITFLVE